IAANDVSNIDRLTHPFLGVIKSCEGHRQLLVARGLRVGKTTAGVSLPCRSWLSAAGLSGKNQQKVPSVARSGIIVSARFWVNVARSVCRIHSSLRRKRLVVIDLRILPSCRPDPRI